MEHCLRPVRAERYITTLFARSLQRKVQHHTRIAGHPNGAVTEHHLFRHLKQFGRLERLSPACSSAKRADAVRISHTPSHTCLFLFVYLINPCNPPCPLHHLPSCLPYCCCCCYSTRLVTLFKLVQAQSPRRLPVLITLPLRHNNLFSSPLRLSLNQNTHFTLQRQHFFHKKTPAFISAGR